MRKTMSVLCMTFSLIGCTEILRKPSLEVVEIEESAKDFEYQVKGYEASPDVVKTANLDPFLRFVTVASGENGQARRIPEKKLFSGRKPIANHRPDYLIGVGDSISISRAGNIVAENGVRTRRSLDDTYLVQEDGSIHLREGVEIQLAGLTVSQAKSLVQNRLATQTDTAPKEFREKVFPVEKPSQYRLGAGDIIRVSRLIETTNGSGQLEQSVQSSQSTVGSNGLVSILQLGEINAAGLTLPEVRDQVLQAAIRNAGGIDTVVEIQSFASQTAQVTGAFGTSTIPVTDQPLPFDRFLAQIVPAEVGEQEFIVKLSRDDQTYQMSLNSILNSNAPGKFYIFGGDRISIEEVIPDINLRLRVASFGARSLTYLRVGQNDAALAQQGTTVPFDLRGIDLRQLLISQGIDVTHNEDLLVRLNRGAKTFMLSAQSIVLNNPSKRYWLAPDDHVVVEDIAYVGDYAMLVGEIGLPRQLPIDRHSRTTLSQALFDGRAFNAGDADFRHIYVLRGEGLNYDAYHFDITQVLNLSLADKFEMRPGDIMFVRTRPLSRYTRALSVALSFVNTVDGAITNSRSFGR